MLNGFRNQVGLKKHNHPIDLLAEANALLSGIALFPQLFKAISTHQVDDLAPTSFFIMVITNTIWQFYGWHRKALPVIISSCLVILTAGTLLTLTLVWKS